jgi:hypothetical protein
VLLQASAIPSSGKTVSGWYVYVDGTAVYNTGAASTISSSLPMSNGRHTVMARAWDTSGAYGDQTISITVTPLRPTVSVSTPAYDANVGSPVNIIAFASPSPGHTISSWSIYSDGVRAYNASAQTMINAKVPLAPGPHNLLVRTWDTSGGYGDQALYVTGNSNPAVAVSAPLPNWNVISPIHIKASATPGSGHTISGWYVYLDGVPAYHAGAVNSIDANISAAAGFHSAIVRAWDNTGAYGDQVLVLQVGQVAVNINTPANGAIVNSPVNIQAGASSSKSIVGWHVYVDSVDSYGQNYGGALNVNLSMKPGAHSIKARAWDSSGAYGDQTTIVTVQ